MERMKTGSWQGFHAKAFTRTKQEKQVQFSALRPDL
jgi:hypothetical protein